MVHTVSDFTHPDKRDIHLQRNRVFKPKEKKGYWCHEWRRGGCDDVGIADDLFGSHVSVQRCILENIFIKDQNGVWKVRGRSWLKSKIWVICTKILKDTRVSINARDKCRKRRELEGHVEAFAWAKMCKEGWQKKKAMRVTEEKINMKVRLTRSRRDVVQKQYVPTKISNKKIKTVSFSIVLAAFQLCMTSVTMNQNKHLIFTSQLSWVFCCSYAKVTNRCRYLIGLHSSFTDNICPLSRYWDHHFS